MASKEILMGKGRDFFKPFSGRLADWLHRSKGESSTLRAALEMKFERLNTMTRKEVTRLHGWFA